MAASNENRSAYRHYPFLTKEEFAEVCHYLDAKYLQATLGPLRNEWRLNVHTAFDTSATSHRLVTFVQITRPLDDTKVDEQLASQLDKVRLQDPTQVRRSRRIQRNQEQSEADRMMIETEEADKVGRIQRIFMRRLDFPTGYSLTISSSRKFSIDSC
jgi:ubiquitin-like-conjugating enzyme ATG10